MNLPAHPSLYQINTRLLLDRLGTDGKKATLKDIPDSYWNYLSEKGIDIVWLMGIWNTNEYGYDRIFNHPDDIKYYQSVLPDLREEDMAGSPYAIDQYVPAKAIGDKKELAHIREVLNARGMRLFVDFVPNHFGVHSELVRKHPDLFIQGDQALSVQYPLLFFKAEHGGYFAHGKDPYFAAWQDTIQVDYSKEKTRLFIIDLIQNLADCADGIRCDMAMLLVRRIFQDNWGQWIDAENPESWTKEFWSQAISEVKKTHPDFLFMAETYWNMEAELQSFGFDYTYDKRLLDRLREGNIHSIQDHLKADISYQKKCVRFLENHDEERAAVSFPDRKLQAASVLNYTLPGLSFHHFGQWESRRVKIPVQINRNPPEQICQDPLDEFLKSKKVSKALEGIIQPICNATFLFYEKLLNLTKSPVFKNGDWQQVYLLPVAVGDESHLNIFCFYWKLKNEGRLVLVNYCEHEARGNLLLTDINRSPKTLMRGLLYDEEIDLFVESNHSKKAFRLDAFRSQIFAIIG